MSPRDLHLPLLGIRKVDKAIPASDEKEYVAKSVFDLSKREGELSHLLANHIPLLAWLSESSEAHGPSRLFVPIHIQKQAPGIVFHVPGACFCATLHT
jgi:hypothetical protein